MTRWEVYSGSDEDWNQNVCNKNAHYRQLTFWGNLKKKKNWKILRLKCTNGETTSIQIFYKKIFFINFFYCAGGPIGSIKNLDESFINFLKKHTNSKVYYIRIDDGSSDLDNLEFLENSKLWNRPKFRMNEAKSAFFELPDQYNMNDLFKNSSRDFKYSLKRSKKKNLTYIYTNNPDSNHLAEISIGMFKKKKIKMMEYQDFENFKLTLKNNMYYIIAYDEEQNPLAYRAVLILKNKAWDIAAATSLRGRKNFAGFGIFEELIKNLVKLSVKKFNLGSLVTENEGVNSFKLGTGAKELLYVGEFEYCNLKFLKKMINLFIAFTLSKRFIRLNFLRRLYF